MAAGMLGEVDFTGQNTAGATVYTCPAGAKYAVLHVFYNLAISNVSSSSTSNRLELAGAVIDQVKGPSDGKVEQSVSLVVGPGQSIIAYSFGGGVTVITTRVFVTGYEVF
jgi:hypothetical protein